MISYKKTLRTKYYNREPYKGHIVNDRIRGETFRLINAQGEQVGVVSRKEAFDYARENETDLILIAPNADPIVVKAIDFHKFLYQEEKKLKESKKGQKKGGTKDIQLSLFIGEGDLERFKNKTQEFLDEGYQVRVRLPLRGRELGKKPMAFEKVKEFLASIEDATVAVEPKMQGRVVTAVLVRQK